MFATDFQLVTNFLLVIGLAFIAYQVNQIKPISQNHDLITNISSNECQKPIAWINGKSKNYDYLFHIKRVFERLGYNVHLGLKESPKKWRILWNHEYPFSQTELLEEIKSINGNQLVNHVPGSGYITSKVYLAQTPLKFGVPLAFSLPAQKREFLDYASENPNIRWVQKSNAHRGIEVVKMDQFDLDKKDTFLQHFVDNPLLIDGRKFDLGIYTVVTSISPLRVYIYEGDVLLRFCTQSYLPFNSTNVDSYVVGDDYTPIWEMPSFHNFYNEQKLTFKASFSAHLTKNGVNANKIWEQIRQIIREVFELNNEKMRVSIKNYKHPSSFFELTRFDFIINENYKVYLMEANMSPNLSSGHFKQSSLLYEQVLMNLFSLIGLSKHYEEGNDFKTAEIEVSDRDLAIQLDQCSDVCKECSVQSEKLCDLCPNCIQPILKENLRNAYREHLNRHQMRRIVPSTESILTLADKLQAQWFKEMCKKDSSFC